MNKKVYFLIIILLSLSASCSIFHKNESSSVQEEIVFDDGYKTSAEGEIVIDDKSFGVEGSNGTFGKSSQETTQLANDGSQIKVMYDGFGNKTETRTFYNNPFLKLILLRIGANGSRQAFVYGKNGEVKDLPEDMLGKVLTSSSQELANSVGIFEPVKETPSFTKNIQPMKVTKLPPLPSSQFPIQNQQVEQTPAEVVEQPADTAEKLPLTKEEIPPTEKKQTASINKEENQQ